MKDIRDLPQVIELRPKKLSVEEQILLAVESAIERSNTKVLGEMRVLNRNLERAVTRLLANAEGVATGDKELAVAAVVEGEQDDLPRLARFKADPALNYTLKAKDIAKAVGISPARTTFLLNAAGLNWVNRKPELWSLKMYKISGTRLWHPRTTDLLSAVLADPVHPERANVSHGCRVFFEKYDDER